MGGFESSVATMNMDVDSAARGTTIKYTQPPASYQPPQPRPHEAAARRQVEDQRTSRTNRDRRSGRSPYSASPTTREGATHAPMPQGHFGAPQPGQGTAFKEQLLGSNTPPEASIQPTFPPPAVTADSPQPSEASQRRPAYLLHRDLVIGKGSYGQVCIASRGEPEGHSNGRSGKRKKFACKCVMLRNDPKYIAKLQEEVNVLRELRGHDNVIRLYDVFCVDNELFIITELGRGGDLFHLLTTHPKHGVTEAYAGTLFNDSAGRPRCSSLCFYVVH
jgi:hypothetical protein